MDQELYKKFMDAVLNNNVNLVESLYKNNPSIYEIGIKYALMTRKTNSRKSFEIVKDILELDPNNEFANYALGVLYEDQELDEKAIKVFDKLLQTQYKIDALIHLTKIKRKQEQYTEAKKYIDEAIKIDSNNIEANLELIEIYMKQKQYSIALDIALETEKIDDKNARIKLYLSKLYLKLNKIEKSYEMIKLSCLLDENNSNYFYQKGIIEKKLNDDLSAIKSFERTIELFPKHYDAHIELSKLYINKDIEKSKSYVEKVLKWESTNVQANIQMGKICIKEKRIEVAKKYFKRALDVKKNDKFALFELAKLEYDNDSIEQAEMYIVDALKVNPNDIHCLLLYGKILYSKNKKIEAEKNFKKILSINPNSSYAYQELGKLYGSQGDYTKSDECLNKALEIDPRDCYTLFSIAENYFDKGNISEAIATLKKAIKIKPDDEVINVEYARFMYVANQKEEAKIKLKAILKTTSSLKARYELTKIMIYEGDIINAKKNLNLLLNTPYNDYALLQLAKIEAIKGNYKEAKKILMRIKNSRLYGSKCICLSQFCLYNNNEIEILKYLKEALKTNSKYVALKSLVTLSIKNNKYNDAFNYFNELILNGVKIRTDILTYLSKELNIFYKEINYDQNYITDLICNYSIDSVKKHIKENSYLFNKNIDLDNLIYEISSNLTKENKLLNYDLYDIYYIKYENVGINNESYLKVMTLPNSSDIIDVCPVKGKEYLNIDLSNIKFKKINLTK